MSYPPSGGYAYPPGGGYPPPQQPPYGAPPQLQQPPYGAPPPQTQYGYAPQAPYPQSGAPGIGFDGLNNQPPQPVGMPTPGGYPAQGIPPSPYNEPQPQQYSLGGLGFAATAAVNFQNRGPYQQPAYGGHNVPHPQPPSSSTVFNQSSYGNGNSMSQNIPREPATQGTVRDFSGFNGQSDAAVLRKAMKGLGTDEKAISNILATRSNAQRQRIKIEFSTLYGKNLIKELKSELSGNYESLVLGLLMPPNEYDAFHLFKAMDGVGTDEKTLIEILCTRNNDQIKDIRETFRKMYQKDLEKELKSETSGHFKRLLVSLVQGARAENVPLDHNKAAADAKALYDAGEARWGTDESRFNVVLATRSFAQLRLTFDEYSKISRRGIEKAIESEMSGDLKDGMLAVVKCSRNRPAYFAERLYKSMKGLGTDDRTLIRVMVSRSEIDMVQIKQEFQRNYGKSLAQFIKEDCSGDYKKLLIQLCGN